MNAHHIRGLAVGGALAGVVALSGCGSEGDAATRPAPTASVAPAATRESPAAPHGMRGSWKRTMRARDWGPAGSGYPVGTWRADIDAQGEVSVYLPGTRTVDFTTRFVVEGRRLTIERLPICPGRTGRYTWRASADALRLSPAAEDACKPRAALFGGTWTRRR